MSNEKSSVTSMINKITENAEPHIAMGIKTLVECVKALTPTYRVVVSDGHKVGNQAQGVATDAYMIHVVPPFEGEMTKERLYEIAVMQYVVVVDKTDRATHFIRYEQLQSGKTIPLSATPPSSKLN